MNYNYTGIIFPLTFFITILIFGLLIIIHESLTIKRLFKIILNDTFEYVPILAFLMSVDFLYSINIMSLSPIALIFANLFGSIMICPLFYALMVLASYIAEISYIN
jgi:hypothetical protein